MSAAKPSTSPSPATRHASSAPPPALHAHGLLRSGFVPPEHIRRLQDYLRLRADHVTMAASHVQHLQKALERMNVKLHDVISSVVVVSGFKVIRAILAGQRDPLTLLSLCDAQIQKKKADAVRESLRGTWKAEHLFALKQALELWEFYQQKIGECDQRIEAVLRELAGPEPEHGPQKPGGKPGGRNTPQIENLHQMLVRLCGDKDATVPAVSLLRRDEAGRRILKGRLLRAVPDPDYLNLILQT